MNYIGSVLFILWPIYTADSLMAYIAYLLDGRKMPYRKVFAVQIPAALFQSMAYSVFVVIDLPSNVLIRYLGESIFSVADIIIPLSCVYFLFRNTEKRKGSFTCLQFIPSGF